MALAGDDTPFAHDVAFTPGVSLVVDASSIVESPAAASCFRRQVFDLAASGLELSITIDSSSPCVMHEAEFEFVFSLSAETMQDAGSPARRLAVVLDSAAVTPARAWQLRCAYLQNGPLYIRTGQPATSADAWQQLWDLRSTIGVRVLCAQFVQSPCRLLPAEEAVCLVPGASVQGPPGSAWVAVVIDLLGRAAPDGSIDLQELDAAVRSAVRKGEELHSETRWPTARLRHDAWLNRRLAIDVRGLGGLVNQRGLNPERFATLDELARLVRRIRDAAIDESQRIAAHAGHVPAIEQANLANALPGGRLREGWSKRWRLAVESTAVRHRNLLVMSPWSLFPPGEPDPRYVNLLPLLRYADTCSVGVQPELGRWKLKEFRGFYQQAAAVLQQRGAAHQIAVRA
jgi:hypothetical protein